MRFKATTLTVVVSALVLMSALAAAGEEPADESLRDNTMGPISIMLEDADVSDVVDSLSTLTGLGVTLADGVELAGKVTVAIEDAPWEEVLTEVLSQVGLGWKQDGGQIVVSGDESADSQAMDADPLAPFERLIGGMWVWGESSTEYEWGVGRQSVKARSYFLVDGNLKLVSEGAWFWHPGEGQIKGVFTAVGMPVALFDYTTRFEGERMVNDLAAYSASGEKTMYVETWEFTDETHYNWKLLQESPDGLQEVMAGTFSKNE
jgi:hypothetical protein